MKACECNIEELDLDIVVLPNIILKTEKDSISDLGNLIISELHKKQDKEDPELKTDNKTIVGAVNEVNTFKQDKYDEGLKTADKTVVGGINEVYNSVPPFAFFEQDWDRTYTIVLPHKSVYSSVSESGLYIEVSLPNECFENTVALYYDLVMPLLSGVEANEDGEDTKTLTIYL